MEDFLNTTSLGAAFHLPLSSQAHAEVRNMQQLVAHVGQEDSQNINDEWTYTWGAKDFSTRRYYKFYFRDVTAHKTYHWLWKSKVTMKIKFFGWLLLTDRLNTRNMLERRHYNIGNNFNCILCDLPIEEDISHMIFQCQFSKLCWTKQGIHWTVQDSDLTMIENAKLAWAKPQFMSIFLQASWSI